MSAYKINYFYSEEDGRYITSVPKLPGCMSDGKTIEEALKNTEEIIREWLETALEVGRELPESDWKSE